MWELIADVKLWSFKLSAHPRDGKFHRSRELHHDRTLSSTFRVSFLNDFASRPVIRFQVSWKHHLYFAIYLFFLSSVVNHFRLFNMVFTFFNRSRLQSSTADLFEPETPVNLRSNRSSDSWEQELWVLDYTKTTVMIFTKFGVGSKEFFGRSIQKRKKNIFWPWQRRFKCETF